ncbi:MAG TPA: tryptophan synthase subunit alpha, partial [Solirubrobacteraceae bacterium]
MTGIDRLAHAFAASGKRAALMPYVMAGFPTLEESLRIGEACVAAGADVIELGVPYSDPLADGPVIHEAGTRALAAGANVAGVLEVARA